VSPISIESIPDGSWPSLATVVPVYNEESGIERSSYAIVSVAERYLGRSIVIVVDDGSSDASATILSGLERELDLLLLCRHELNAGYGAALRTGARRAADLGFEYVAFIDSDLTNPPDDLLKIGELARQGHTYIKGSRFIFGGGMVSVPFWRQAVSRAGNTVGRRLFQTQVRDITNGFRAVRTDVFLSWPLHERGFSIIVEELDWALRTDVEPVEFPTILMARQADQRGSTFTYDPKAIYSYLRYPMRAQMRRLRTTKRAK
jgi:glycosyltransferase involved in cell wall biosynthesis